MRRGKQPQRKDKSGRATITKSYEAELTAALVEDALGSYLDPLPGNLLAAVREYALLLLRWNTRINLTAITNPRELVERHFGESFFAARFLPGSASTLVDVGTGPGFPGIPLKMLRPELRVHLVESSTKKCAFLAEVSRLLRLQEVHIHCRRMEDVEFETERADVVAARAVGNIESLLAWGGKVLAADGSVALWLGSSDAQVVQRTSGWRWAPPIAIPRSLNRVLLLGTRCFT